MDIEERRKANREKFPEFAKLADEGYTIEWAKHEDGTEIGKMREFSNCLMLSADTVIALSSWDEAMKKGKK